MKPSLPGKMCTLTSVVQSQHAIGQTLCIPRTSISEYNKAFRASWCVHSAHGVCVLQNTLVVCVFVDTKMNTMSETGQFMSSTYYVRVRNRASTCITNESVHQGAKKSQFLKFSALMKLLSLLEKRLLPQHK